MTFLVTHFVKADNPIEAGALAYLKLPAEHRTDARLERCERERWLPSHWNVTFCLPTMDVADAIVPDYFNDPEAA